MPTQTEIQKQVIDNQIADLQRQSKELEKADTPEEKKDLLKEIKDGFKALKEDVAGINHKEILDSMSKKLDQVIADSKNYFDLARNLKLLILASVALQFLIVIMVIFLLYVAK